MSNDEIDKTIEEVMKEIRASPDYSGHSCSAHSDTQCSQNKCSSDNPKRLKKGIYCGIKPHCEQNQIINQKN